MFYRLVVVDQIPKTEKGYKTLCEALNLARRGKLIDMSCIRDDGFRGNLYTGFSNGEDYLRAVQRQVTNLELDLQDYQPVRLVVWCEAAGMVPQLETVTRQYSIPVVSRVVLIVLRQNTTWRLSYQRMPITCYI